MNQAMSQTLADRNRGNLEEYVAASLPEAVNGTLNPTWVEWLQGFPLGWTDLDASATQSFPKSPSGSEDKS